MPHKPPQPLAPTFLLCREIFQDNKTGEHLLVAPFTSINFAAFPAALRVSLYIVLTGGHGTYYLGLQLRDAAGHLIGEAQGPQALAQDDPLAYSQLCWRDLVLQFPQPGRYDLVLLVNGDDLSHLAINAIWQAR